MKKTVRQVVFKDVSCDFSFLGTSTMDSKETGSQQNESRGAGTRRRLNFPEM
jgi:hypothetical protein